LVFDLDDTLFPEHQFVLSGFAAVDEWLQSHFGLVGFLQVATLKFQSGVRGRIFDEAIDLLGWSDHGISIDTMLTVYREHRPTIELHEDARWAIERTSGSFCLGLLTDGFLATQKRKVEALGIADHFDAIVYSDEFGRDCWKPSPVPYQALMERLGGPAESFTYVSDNPTKDFVTANALGWRTVRIIRPDGEYRDVIAPPRYDAPVHITTLRDLPFATGYELDAPARAIH
jgi:putative hydrolase of the HAD superfamily